MAVGVVEYKIVEEHMIDLLYFCFSDKTIQSLTLQSRSVSGYIQMYGNNYVNGDPDHPLVIQISRIQSDENEHLLAAYLATCDGMRTDVHSTRFVISFLMHYFCIISVLNSIIFKLKFLTFNKNCSMYGNDM